MTTRKPGASPDSVLVSRQHCMQKLDIGETTLDGLIADGELVRVKIGRRALVTRGSLNEYIERIIAQASA